MIAITAALKNELKYLIRKLQNVEKVRVNERNFYVGTIADQKVVLSITGVGKIKTASTTQLLICNYKPQYILHVGSGGALSKEVKIGDFILGTEIVEHDYYEKFQGPQPAPRHKTTDQLNQLLWSFDKATQKLKTGIIVSGNEDIVETERRDTLFKQYGGLSVDWESSASVHTANINKTPNTVIRAIVDYAYENTLDEFKENLNKVSENLGLFVFNFISQTG